MAVDLQYFWCVDFPSSSGWYSDPGNFEHMYGSSYTCSRGWVVLPSDVWNGAIQSGSLLTSASSGSPSTPDFYADSTQLFYLFFAAVVAVFALKAIVMRLFHAS